MKKTNAVRLLDQKNITYSLHPYTYDPDKLEVSAVAGNLGFPTPLLYKTLVAIGDKTGVLVALVPGDLQLNPKALAKISGNKKIALAAVKELQGITGYIRGGCSPLGMKKNFPLYIHESASGLEVIYINAGQRGLMIGIAADDLIAVTRAVVGTLC
ncbi:MAG: Cys-tRNA(Pro)/Cys-tRNA(Cys) deacylase [Polaribacter sp.]|jgi:Cys-tRNA(Pro)/Cys-tRNA(Cys) deacylase